jgi:hypothetical protein
MDFVGHLWVLWGLPLATHLDTLNFLSQNPLLRKTDMKDELKARQASHPRDEEAAILPSSRKAAYSSPILQVYGSVSKLTQGVTSKGGDANGTKKSDRRAKENIARVGTHPLGVGLYLFDYLPEHCVQAGHGRQFGVMADEVEAVMPAAVSVDADGYQRVDYAMLGIRHPVH